MQRNTFLTIENYSYNNHPHPHQEVEHGQHPKQPPFCPHYCSLSLQSNCSADFCHHRVILSTFKVYINGITQYMFLCLPSSAQLYVRDITNDFVAVVHRLSLPIFYHCIKCHDLFIDSIWVVSWFQLLQIVPA